MKWTPQKKFRLSKWSETEYSLPFRYTPAAKNIFLSTEYKQSQYPELSYLYPGFEQFYNKYITQEEKLKTILRYIEACILHLEKDDTCPNQTLCDWWTGLIDDNDFTDYIETLIETVSDYGAIFVALHPNCISVPEFALFKKS